MLVLADDSCRLYALRVGDGKASNYFQDRRLPLSCPDARIQKSRMPV